MTVIKKCGIILLILGTVLIGSALSLLLYNRQEDIQASQSMDDLIGKLQATIEQPTITPVPSETETEPVETRPAEMETVIIDGYEYIGYLSIPTLDLELPVMAQWDYTRLKIAPCRESGATATNDLVIAAHNYNSHFGRLKQLQPGENITFTEMDGFFNSYRVEKTVILAPDQVEDVLLSDYDLVLYTCTKGGATRVVVYCNRENQEVN